MRKNSTDPHPVAYESFEALYLRHLADTDRPSCYVAYCRAEAEMVSEHGRRRYANHKAFRNTMSRRNARQKTEDKPEEKKRVNIYGRENIKCQLCDIVLYTVPRGDLRTIIPQTCQICTDRLRRVIFDDE